VRFESPAGFGFQPNVAEVDGSVALAITPDYRVESAPDQDSPEPHSAHDPGTPGGL
jgi:hypothetical protein